MSEALNSVSTPLCPLGVMSRDMWLESRCLELTRAIKECLNGDGVNGETLKWSEELSDLLWELKVEQEK